MEFQHNVKTFSKSVNADGSLHISYSGSCVLLPKIDFNALLKLKASSEESLKLLKQSTDLINTQRNSLKELHGALKTAKEDVVEDYLTSHRGGYDKQGCGRRADAEMVAKAVGGASIDELLKGRYTYDKYGHRRAYSRGRIFKALSVKKPEDYGRITSLINDFPDVFVSVGIEAVYCWMQKKASKGGKNL